jgi:hypothetical protein
MGGGGGGIIACIGGSSGFALTTTLTVVALLPTLPPLARPGRSARCGANPPSTAAVARTFGFTGGLGSDFVTASPLA